MRARERERERERESEREREREGGSMITVKMQIQCRKYDQNKWRSRTFVENEEPATSVGTRDKLGGSPDIKSQFTIEVRTRRRKKFESYFVKTVLAGVRRPCDRVMRI